MQAGKLRHRVTIQQPIRTVSASGEETVEYYDERYTQASINALNGSAAERSRQLSPEASHLIRIRVNKNFTVTTMTRVKFGSQIYDIKFAEDVMERGIYLELHAAQYRGADGDKTGY